MPAPSNAIPLAPADGVQPGEALYQSPSTRVVRFGAASGADSIVCKEYFGPQAAQRQRNETNLLRRLAGIEGVPQLAKGAQGANVLTLRDCGGTSLGQVLKEGKCDTNTVLVVGSQLARILAEVHRAGIIHRDINPTNILISATHEAVLIDFDLAVLAVQPLAVEPGGQIVGTLSYMAPEQTGRTGRAVDQRADLYGLGATLYEMAVGHPPFEQADALQLIRDHLVREPVAPHHVDAQVPPGLSNIILRLLAKAPEQRYHSAEGLLHDLQLLHGKLEQGQCDVFELGERDFAVRFAAPAHLVGREDDLAKLQSAFAGAMNSAQRAVLIDGPSGVGKSALINELRPVAAKAGAWFVYGKFDQYRRDGSTDGALAQAVRALGRQLLTQSADQIEAQRQRILQSLGRNAGMITGAFPEFALLLGEHAYVPEADPRHAEVQMRRAVLDLLGAIASPMSPLVLVVDDLQWAGAFSFQLFEAIMLEPQLRGLLVVGSYRSDEIDAGHALLPMLARWRQLALAPLQISLANLSLADIGEMTRQMLRLAPEPSRELAEALNALTGGNPFDTIEMINALRVDGVLSLGASGWHWDEAKVRHFIGRGNVVDLLAARINRLAADARELLEFMSALGSNVEFKLVCAAVGLSAGELRARLRGALDDGLLVADPTSEHDTVRFRHDRVQQAILGAMDDVQRGARQLAMARRLADEPAFESEAAQQYLACAGMLDQPEEQRRAARLFFGVAQTLASTATFLLAERYLASADALLAAIDEASDAALRRAIDVARHRALYSLGRVEDADPFYARIQARTQDPLDLVDPTCLQMRRLDMHGRMSEALVLGVGLLAQLGLHVPPDFSDPHRERRLDALSEWVRQDEQLDYSKRAPTQDARLLGIYKLLSRMMGSAYFAQNINASTWALLESQRLWAEHGPSDDLIGCVNGLANLLIVRRQDYQTGYAIARHVLAVGEALGFEVRTAASRFIFSWYMCPWFEPLEHALDQATRACEAFQAKGDDSILLSFFHAPKYQFLLEIAPTLESGDAEVEAALSLSRRAGNVDAFAIHTCERQFLRLLRGQTKGPDSFDDEEFSEQAFIAKVSRLPSMRLVFAPYRAFRALLWGDATELAKHASGGAVLSVYGCLYRSMHGYLCLAMARAWQLQQGDRAAPESAPLIAELESCRSWIASRAADQPYNFLHLLRLVEAEQAWALGDLWRAASTFDEAVVEAEARQRPWHRALITERAGIFHLAQGLAGTGRSLLTKARDQYRDWGASAKVDQMQRDHAFLRVPARSLAAQLTATSVQSDKGRSNISSDVLDLLGVLRASQALSSETSLEQLTARVTEVLIALSGATRALVLTWEEGQWWLLAPTPGESALPVSRAANRAMVPFSAVGYADRTGTALVVDDALADDRFARDPYFAGVAVCSLLLVPIASQGTTRAMLVLENRLGRAAFNAQRLDAVMLIAGQLAVSLTNARLYENLERRVLARTRELQETQAQLVTTARRAGMAEVANNVLHNVGNVCNSITVSASMAHANLVNSKLHGLRRAVDLMNSHEADIGDFMGRDPQGKAWRQYLNELVGALDLERSAVLHDLDRLTRSVEHVNHVLTTQQSNAGASRLLEMARVDELMEEALRMNSEVVAERGIRVLRAYGQAPVTALDKPRLLQILVNLIGNAVEAMAATPQDERELTLGIAVVNGADDALGSRLLLSVRDRGEGIAQENLTRIFAHGFTTRAKGHGFGLHSSAVAAMEMDGRLTAQSEGRGGGGGAVFTLELPITS